MFDEVIALIITVSMLSLLAAWPLLLNAIASAWPQSGHHARTHSDPARRNDLDDLNHASAEKLAG